jgi:hypothetical protein
MANPWLAMTIESEIALASAERGTERSEASACQTLPSTKNGILGSQEEVLFVEGFGDSIVVDYVTYVCERKDRRIQVVTTSANWGVEMEPSASSIRSIVLFIRSRLSESDRRLLQQIVDRFRDVKFIGLISTFRVHLGDQRAAQTEAYVLQELQPLGARMVVFRPGHVLSRHSPISKRLRQFGFCCPLVPRRFRSCFVEGGELFAAIESERETSSPRRAQPCTLLGPNQEWRHMLARHRAGGVGHTCMTAICSLLSLLLLGHLAGLVLDLVARIWPTLRQWSFDTLRPQSLRELLTLYNKYNYQHLKIVGYNNGVIHFGHCYPGKTVVSTVFCNRIRRISPQIIKADCGATVRKALDFLAETDQELPVVPNYSYVCVGTSFFIPIHGSASDFSTIADTITRAIFFDPVRDRFIATSRDEPEFQERVYNLREDILLLRLYLKVKPKSRYFVQRQELVNPHGRQLVAALRDCRARNVEIRQASASSDKITVSKYYNSPQASNSPVMELPRDALGRLWDRLEENRITSFLMHALTRYFAWHIELFFTPEEFPKFWESHRNLPLRKIQLRYIRRDGFPHSAFRDHDCVSVDLFMLRWRRRRFEKYLKETFDVVRTNPGKHSR